MHDSIENIKSLEPLKIGKYLNFIFILTNSRGQRETIDEAYIKYYTPSKKISKKPLKKM